MRRQVRAWRAAALALSIGVVAAATPGVAEPWRLQQAIGDPEWLEVDGDFRVRFEFLDEQFRPGRAGEDHILPIRTRLRARVALGSWLGVGAELQDSRSYVEDANAPIGTGQVNGFELLRAYLEATGDVGGGTLRAQAGRITMNLGSRRLVARNRFRNTANAFTGIDVEWSHADGHGARAFYTLPVRRLPSSSALVRDNRVEFDEESFDAQFWGLWGKAQLGDRDTLELYLLGLHEDDATSRARDLYTPGLRILRTPATARFDFQLESVLQFGESRRVSRGPQLDHFAHFHHLQVGYRFDAPWSPRLAFQFDYASGDEDPGDGRNERFDTLFGARRGEYGPTSSFGPFARGNLVSPGLRLQLAPTQRITGFVSVRAFWLAEERDVLVGGGVSDPSGNSGRTLGTQIEIRTRIDLIPGNLRLELGFAHVFEGRFLEDAPNANGGGDPNFAYAALSLAF